MSQSSEKGSITRDMLLRDSGCFGGREKYDKTKVFMIPVYNRKQETLVPLIKKWIKPRTIIHSDCWKSYNKLSKLGYTHVTVNHSK